MQQLTTLWQSLDPRKRIIVVLATLAMFSAVYGVATLATRPSMALLYAGLDEARAGEVLAALDQRGAKYEVRGQAIYVQVPDVDAIVAKAQAAGGAVCVPAFDAPGVGRIAMIADPTGAACYVITLRSRP